MTCLAQVTFFSLEIILESDGPHWMCALHQIVSVGIILIKASEPRETPAPSPSHRHFPQPLAAACAFSNSAFPWLGPPGALCSHHSPFVRPAPALHHPLLTSRMQGPGAPPTVWPQDPKKRRGKQEWFLCSRTLFSDLLLTFSRSCRNSGGSMECCGKSMTAEADRLFSTPKRGRFSSSSCSFS